MKAMAKMKMLISAKKMRIRKRINIGNQWRMAMSYRGWRKASVMALGENNQLMASIWQWRQPSNKCIHVGVISVIS